MNKIIINRMYEPMSDKDLKKYNPDVKILLYPDIYHYNNIDSLFGNTNKIIILYLTSSFNNGHWTCLLRKYDNIYFFDSYGLNADDEQKYVKNMYIKEETGENYKYLRWLLHNSHYNIVENKIKLQGPDTYTCGRYCSLRLINSNLSNDEFIRKYFMNTKKTPDYIVSELIE